MSIKLNTPVQVLIGITASFICGYVVNDFLNKQSDASAKQQYPNHTSDIGALGDNFPGNNSNASGRVLEATPALANARAAPQAIIVPTISSKNERAREQQNLTGGLDKPASTNALDTNEIERIKEEAVSAFVSGANIKTLITTKEFSKLTIEDQNKVMDRMVQLVNDGAVSADQIYGSRTNTQTP